MARRPTALLATLLILHGLHQRIGWADDAPVFSEGRLAVLIVPDRATPAELADNLAEVVISRIAERRHVQMAGTAELRKRLGLAVRDHERAAACFEDITCLGRAAVALGVRRVVTGSIRQEAGHYLVQLVLNDVQTGKVDGRFFRLVEGTIDDLIHATQEGTDELFRSRPEPARLRVESVPPGSRVAIDGIVVGTTPLVSGPLIPGRHALRVERDRHFPWATEVNLLPANELEIRLTADQLPWQRRWPSYVMGGSLAGAGIAVALGVSLGTLSQTDSSTGNRGDLQDDIERRQQLAFTANVAFACSAALVATAVVVYYLYRRDVLGE